MAKNIFKETPVEYIITDKLNSQRRKRKDSSIAITTFLSGLKVDSWIAVDIPILLKELECKNFKCSRAYFEKLIKGLEEDKIIKIRRVILKGTFYITRQYKLLKNSF